MTKEKIIDLVDNYVRLDYDVEFDGSFGWVLDKKKFADTLLAKFEQEKTDLLKEFVEYMEDRLTIWVKDEHYQANIAEAENDNLRKNTSLLIAETIEAIKNSMKPALEKFLEERKL